MAYNVIFDPSMNINNVNDLDDSEDRTFLIASIVIISVAVIFAVLAFAKGNKSK